VDYLVEMLLFIPPIFILVGLLDVWVPRKIVGKTSARIEGQGYRYLHIGGHGGGRPLVRQFSGGLRPEEKRVPDG
jgi:hypothetical protein